MSAHRKTQHKVESESGWRINRETGATEAWDGIRILWRFDGERRWRRQLVLPAPGQTIAELKLASPEIVAALAAEATAP